MTAHVSAHSAPARASLLASLRGAAVRDGRAVCGESGGAKTPCASSTSTMFASVGGTHLPPPPRPSAGGYSGRLREPDPPIHGDGDGGGGE